MKLESAPIKKLQNVKARKIMLIAPISAIPSWEGFEYQRHIALYIALKHIWHELKLGNDKEVNL